MASGSLWTVAQACKSSIELVANNPYLFILGLCDLGCFILHRLFAFSGVLGCFLCGLSLHKFVV